VKAPRHLISFPQRFNALIIDLPKRQRTRAVAATGPFPVAVRYRYGENGEGRDASFYGLSFDRSEAALLGRLKEAHRFAAWVEVVEVRWRDARAGAGAGRAAAPAPGPPDAGRAGAVRCVLPELAG
jgi:hypothetical protein